METKPLSLTSVRAVLEQYGKAVKDEYVAELVAHKKPTTRNTLAGTARYIVEEDNGTFEISLELEEYWKYVEYGRKPGKKPPFDKILEWVQIKPVIPQPDEETGKIPTEKQLAAMICHHIEAFGIPATNYLQQSVKVTDDKFRKLIAQAAQQDVTRYISSLFVDGQLTKEDGNFKVLQSFDITQG